MSTSSSSQSVSEPSASVPSVSSVTLQPTSPSGSPLSNHSHNTLSINSSTNSSVNVNTIIHGSQINTMHMMHMSSPPNPLSSHFQPQTDTNTHHSTNSHDHETKTPLDSSGIGASSTGSSSSTGSTGSTKDSTHGTSGGASRRSRVIPDYSLINKNPLVICVKNLSSFPITKGMLDRIRIRDHKRIKHNRVASYINVVCPSLLDTNNPLIEARHLWLKNPRSLFNGWLIEIWMTKISNIDAIIKAVRSVDPKHCWSITDNGFARPKRVFGFLKCRDKSLLSVDKVTEWASSHSLTSFEVGHRIKQMTWDDSYPGEVMTFTIAHSQADRLTSLSYEDALPCSCWRYRTPEIIICYKCNKVGHTKKECTTVPSQYHCEVCHRLGNHSADSCPTWSDSPQPCLHCKKLVLL
jgi:hypothetical protein